MTWSRGKAFVDMTSIRHAYYAGPTYNARDYLEGQVVIDNSHVFVMNRDDMPRPRLEMWTPAGAPMPPPDYPATACSAECCADDIVWSDEMTGIRRNVEYLETHMPETREDKFPLYALGRQIAEVQEDRKALKITDDEYMIMSDRVYGFVLRSRKWAELDLAYLSKVNYGTDEPTSGQGLNNSVAARTAFDDLVLPPGHREVILGLVAQHFREVENHEVDIFRGKGKGLILLLHGAPGVGKTSTAEGVAEAFEKPLLQITCGKRGPGFMHRTTI